MLLKKFELELLDLKDNNTFRYLKNNNADVINLASNDYLGYGSDTKLYDEFMLENKVIDFGASGSRLLTGNHSVNVEFESYLAKLYHKEALLFTSGYCANSAVIKTIMGSEDVIFMDNTNHASLFDSAFSSKARVITYKHLDYEDLYKKLAKYRNKYKQALIVSESIFSMDGDIFELGTLCKLKLEFNAFLYIDEAHSFGIYGDGLGMVSEQNLVKEVDFIMLGFGKALNSSGAAIITSELFKNYLINKSKEFIYTTALSPILVNYNYYMVKKLVSDDVIRKQLENNYKLFNLDTPIMALKTYDAKNSKELCEILLTNGFLTYPINYPTVKKGQSIVRIVISAAHTKDTLEKLKLCLEDYGFIF